MVAIIYKPQHETQRLWERQEKFKASWKPAKDIPRGSSGDWKFYSFSLGVGYRVIIGPWRFPDLCVLLGASYSAETAASHTYRIISDLKYLCMCVYEKEKGRGKKGKGEGEEGERTVGGGRGRERRQWQWLGGDLRESWPYSPSSAATKSPDPATKRMLSTHERNWIPKILLRLSFWRALVLCLYVSPGKQVESTSQRIIRMS